MKKFIVSSTIFLLLPIIATNIRPLFLIYTDKYKSTVAGWEIYHSIFKSKQKKKTKKIIIGDSVANQLFNNTTNNDTINSLTCNRAIGIVGHYFLLNNYLKSENQVDTVFMIFTPFSFLNNLNEVYTYHYFLKPFYTNEYKSLFTKSVNEQIQKIPYFFMCRYPYILTSNWAPDFTSQDKINYTFLSPISIEYLTRIKELSVKYNFKLIILSTPIPASKKSKIENIDKNEIVKNNFGQEFKNYFNTITYLDDSLFLDSLHLKKPSVDFYTDYYRKNYLK